MEHAQIARKIREGNPTPSEQAATRKAKQDLAKAEKLLQKAEQHCLVANSLNAKRHLQYQVEVIADCLKKTA